jgi:Protein of unknown function (DUF2804)
MTAQPKTDLVDLPAAPATPVDANGAPAFGAYLGECADVSWARLDKPWARGPIWRLLHAKRWHYVSIAGPRVVLAFAVVDVGYAANAFVYLFDRGTRALLADVSVLGLPGFMAKVSPTADAGARTTWSSGTVKLMLERTAAGWTVMARAPNLEIDATLGAPTAPTLCAIARIERGVANCTHKMACLPVHGLARAGKLRFDLDGSTAAIDHTYGLLARDTTWRWVSAARPDLALNLSQGFNGSIENAVWHEGRLHPVGAAEIVYDASSATGAWRIRTLDGVVDLTFRPEGQRRQDKDLFIAKSRYVQPIGTFSGTIKLPDGEIAVADLVGVTEDHTARW